MKVHEETLLMLSWAALSKQQLCLGAPSGQVLHPGSSTWLGTGANTDTWVREVIHREEEPAGIWCEADLGLLGSPKHHCIFFSAFSSDLKKTPEFCKSNQN